MGTAAAPALTAAQELAAARAVRVSVLTAACAKAITGGFNSSALGTPHTYGSTPTDQGNLRSAVLTGGNFQEWCAHGAGPWEFVTHTAAQMIQVHADMATMIAAARTRLADLKAGA